MGETCRRNLREEKYMQRFSRNLMYRDYLENIDVDLTITLKWILKTRDWVCVVWTGVSCVLLLLM
jgi:hypothetical protein